MALQQESLTLDMDGLTTVATPQKHGNSVLPSTPSTCPGTPSPASVTLASRIASLKEAAARAPELSISLMWPKDGQPKAAMEALPDQQLWESILVKFGACGVPAALDAQHFENVIRAGMDANAVPFPGKERSTGLGKTHAWPDETSKVSATCQDLVRFPFPLDVVGAHVHCTCDAEREALERMHDGRAQEPHELREAIHKMPPLDMELVPWPYLQTGVVAADECTEAQLHVWTLREAQPLLQEQVEKRRAFLARKLKADLNRRIFEELRPTLEREAALLELRAAQAREKAEEARLYDELASEGSASVAWLLPQTGRWPEQSPAWKQHCKWFAMWRTQPTVPSSFAFKPLKRSNSESSFSSWAAVSDVSWVEIESEASECGWQGILAQQSPALTAAHPTRHIKKCDITEVKCLLSPPSGVLLTLEVICILLQVPPKRLKSGGVDYWEPSKKLLSQLDFMDKLCTLSGFVPASVLDAVAPYISREDFTPEMIRRQSKACGGLCTWARELYKFHVLGQASAEAAWRQNAQKPAEVLLAQSKEALQSLSKAVFEELKALSKPPKSVGMVCECLLHVLAGVDPEIEVTKKNPWGDCQRFLLRDPVNLMKKLEEFPDAIQAGRVPRRNMERARKIQTSMGGPWNDEEAMKKRCCAAVAGLCPWLMHMFAYYDQVRPAAHHHPHGKEAKKTAAEVTHANAGLLDKADIIELKALSKPPQAVVVVCCCVCILRPLGKEDANTGWAGARAMLSDLELLKALQRYKVEDVQEEQIVKVREIMSREKEVFQDDRMRNVSKAAWGLMQWVRAVVEKYEAAREAILD